MVAFSIPLILFSMIAYIVIKNTNDHEECNTRSEIVFSTNGEKIVSEIHVCKENFNL
jgi:hypothetical protein